MRSQFVGLYYRELARVYRSPFILLVTVVQPFMWLAFFGSTFANAPPSFLEGLFHTSSYVAFLLPGVLSTSMLSVGMFGSMSTIQDKRLGYMKRILLTPTPKGIVFLAKALGSTTRGLIQIPVMAGAALAFGVPLPTSPLLWGAWALGLFLLGLGFAEMFMAITAPSTDWQTPGAVANFITMPLMFSSQALFPSTNFPWWMLAISRVNPISYSATFGRAIVLGEPVPWTDLGYLALFAGVMVAIGLVVAQRWLRVE